MRQRFYRYTIRAGRNLPDKEFRYLRTVIVTAAVYWGFTLMPPLAGSQMRLTFQHRAGVSPYTSSSELAETCVFAKQSQKPLYCRPLMLSLCGFTLAGHPLFRSYGAILPSSLRRVISSALVYSTSLPVSVYGTVTHLTHLNGFSRQCSINQFTRSVDWAPIHLSPMPCGTGYRLRRAHPIAR